ncbi:MAG: J domain-containing protein [Ilumatobacteraceae bacterium]
MTHYETLGVSRTATHAEIKAAFRAAARRHHPDAVSSDGTTRRGDDRMASLNEAWRVLGDERRRVDYDRALDGAASGAGGTARPSTANSGAADRAAWPSSAATRRNPLGRYLDPPRFPWRPMLAVIALGSAAVLLAAARMPSTPLRPVDGRLMPGECTVIDVEGNAIETLCDGSQDGVVDTIVVDAISCPQQTRAHRAGDGGGVACVRV